MENEECPETKKCFWKTSKHVNLSAVPSLWILKKLENTSFEEKKIAIMDIEECPETKKCF